mmetsp:Transcript_375/g.450  ORF Transcript_375/g.450 Transcript_375/m.450 type:complete len:82 (+) Transcript_375:16-261(+)
MIYRIDFFNSVIKHVSYFYVFFVFSVIIHTGMRIDISTHSVIARSVVDALSIVISFIRMIDSSFILSSISRLTFNPLHFLC